MGLINIRLGDYIKRSTENNSDLKYGEELIKGVNSSGVFASPKGSTLEVDLKPYKIVNNEAFVYNPTRLNLGSLAYRTEGLCIVSHLYIIFYLTDEGKKIINPQWLYIYFHRNEFKREVTFRNFGSQRPEFNFNDMSDITVPLPDIKTQQKYVDVYNAMVANQKAYERGLEDLKLTCDAYIDKLKNRCDAVPIGNYITQIDHRNNENILYTFKGLSMENYFIDSVADSTGLNFSNYKIIAPGEYAAVLMKVGRDGRITIARNDSKENFLISPAYYSFKVDNINSNYFRANVNRLEFERRGWFACDTSARSSLTWTEFLKLSIPKANHKEQKVISNLYETLKSRNSINEKLKVQIKDICPILIKGSIEEGRNTKEA
ncbi:MAG: restriction endonuclease subunit S [Lactobacillus iners]|nr:restriction endonuclease subunit S [Lactobacillus iners]